MISPAPKDGFARADGPSPESTVPVSTAFREHRFPSRAQSRIVLHSLSTRYGYVIHGPRGICSFRGFPMKGRAFEVGRDHERNGRVDGRPGDRSIPAEPVFGIRW